MSLFPCLVLLLALMPGGAGAQHDGHVKGGPPPKVGKVVFPNSGAPAAQEPFLRGVALLHSYEYYDARESFQQAERADAAFALAYWAEAFTYSQFDWGTEDLPAAQAALAKLAPAREARLARAGNERERVFGSAVESFLDGRGTPIERARAFASAMAAWSSAAPSDVEAMAFAARGALFVLRYAPPAERLQRAEDAIRLAERVIAADPAHPGGLHYLVHATDSPRFASKGLDAARAYEKVAPDSDHALHMPSHIYLQLGLWTQVSSSNERAWAASRSWVARGKHGVTALGWHSLMWLQYSRLQEGRLRDARALIEMARKILAAAPSDSLNGYPDARYAIETLEFQYGAETGDWTRAGGTAPDAKAYAARAVAAPSLREQTQALAAAYHAVVAMAGRRDATASEGVDAIRAAFAGLAEDNPRRARADQFASQLDAIVADARGDHAGAVERMSPLLGGAREAGVAPVGPPFTRPLAEMMGAALAAAGRFGDAALAYAGALDDRPNRSAALLGLARARHAAGDSTAARAAYAKLMLNWAHADANVPGLAEAKAGSR